MKTIELETKDAKILIELMERGLAYTDAYYRDYKKVSNVSNKVIEQLHAQGMTSGRTR